MNQPADDQLSRQAPWLEYALASGQRVQRQPLGEQPVKLGRSETADIQIDSPKVSREHARVMWEAGEFWVQDLGSTNGTFVNGERIERARLADGDVFLVADVEFAFFANSTERLRHMATQQMTANPRPSQHSDPRRVERENWEAVLALRAAQHELLAGVQRPSLAKIEEHLAPLPFALLERPRVPMRAGLPSKNDLLQPPLRTQCRLREASRWEAWSRYSNDAPSRRLLVTVESWEISANPGLFAHFEDLAWHTDGADCVVAVVPANEAVDLPEVGEFCRELQRLGIGIACDGFLGSHAHVKQFESLRPQALILAPQMVDDLLTQSKCADRLAAVADACRKRQIQPAVEGLDDPHARTLCLIQGIRLFVAELAAQDEAAEGPAVAVDSLEPTFA
jgi:pSer/pThr/pTyr-binding forkhead associated (FHA) protein/EAL domain-containing protein (putative c-di-GMP-specific phosphodiesterase class I)